jgi:hypothetical protein
MGAVKTSNKVPITGATTFVSLVVVALELKKMQYENPPEDNLSGGFFLCVLR